MEQQNPIPPNQFPPNQMQPAANKNYGLYSLLASTVGFFIFAPAGAILAIVFGTQAKKNPSITANDLTMARIGLILGWIEIATLTVLVIFLISMFSTTY